MILNQPERQPHDYSKKILRDKSPVLSTYEDQDTVKRSNSKDNPKVSAEIDNGPLDQTDFNLTPLSDKATAWDTMWSGIRKWREKNV